MASKAGINNIINGEIAVDLVFMSLILKSNQHYLFCYLKLIRLMALNNR